MGDPIKVGDHFDDYNTVKEFTIKNYCSKLNGSIYDVRSLNTASRDIFNINGPYTGGSCIAQGRKYGANAEIYSDWRDGNQSIYSSEYKPKGLSQQKDSDNVPFTTIYDWGYNPSTGERYYLKAIDINGNNRIDEGEITKYKSEEELFGQN